MAKTTVEFSNYMQRKINSNTQLQAVLAQAGEAAIAAVRAKIRASSARRISAGGRGGTGALANSLKFIVIGTNIHVVASGEKNEKKFEYMLKGRSASVQYKKTGKPFTFPHRPMRKSGRVIAVSKDGNVLTRRRIYKKERPKLRSVKSTIEREVKRVFRVNGIRLRRVDVNIR